MMGKTNSILNLMFLLSILFIHKNECEDLNLNKIRRRSVKKELIASETPPTHLNYTNPSVAVAENGKSSAVEKNNTNMLTSSPEPVVENMNLPYSPSDNSYDLPDSIRSFYYVFIGLGGIAVTFIIYKAYQLRKSRAERRYGVVGDRSGQELTPLGLDDDSDNDHTLFEINRNP